MNTTTPSPTTTATSPTTTATITATASATAPVLYVYSTLPASGQSVAVVYTVTAGEVGIMALDLGLLCVMLFMVFVMVVRRDR